MSAADTQGETTVESLLSSADHDDQPSAASTYPPLDAKKEEIRILIIRPDPEPEAELRVTFKTVSLKDNPKFVALSYCWGDPKVCESVLLDGQPKSVTISLKTALRQFRADAGDRPFELWADALCINQNDLAEKSQQVNLMKRLYSQATEVRIWLGPADTDTERAFRCLHHIISTGLIAVSKLDFEAGFDEVHKGTTALASLFRNAYWTRRWTLQEMLLAQHRTLHCGSWSEPWSLDGVLKLFVYFQGLQARGATDQAVWLAMNDSIQSVFPLLNKLETTADYKQFLLDTKTNECSRSRDIVYAVLGVFPSTLDIKADYEKPLNHVLADYVYRLMLKLDHIDILYQLRTTDPRHASWVPELRAEVLKQERRWFPIPDSPSHRSLQSQLYRCSARSTPNLGRPRPNTLRLQGLYLDTIVAIGSVPRDDENTHLSNPQHIRSRLPDDWWNLYFSHCLPHPENVTDEDIGDALFRIYHLDQCVARHTNTPERSHEADQHVSTMLTLRRAETMFTRRTLSEIPAR